MTNATYDLSFISNKDNRVEISEEIMVINGDVLVLCDTSLACKIGLRAALIAQAVHQVLDSSNQAWVTLSYADWKKLHMPWLSSSTIRHYFNLLRFAGILEVKEPASRNRSQSYRINYEVVERLLGMF